MITLIIKQKDSLQPSRERAELLGPAPRADSRGRAVPPAGQSRSALRPATPPLGCWGKGMGRKGERDINLKKVPLQEDSLRPGQLKEGRIFYATIKSSPPFDDPSISRSAAKRNKFTNFFFLCSALHRIHLLLLDLYFILVFFVLPLAFFQQTF